MQLTRVLGSIDAAEQNRAGAGNEVVRPQTVCDGSDEAAVDQDFREAGWSVGGG
jgi:hypothetical protein